MINKKSITFKELYEHSHIDFIINVYCLDNNKIEYLSYKTTPTLSVCKAIIMAISIPIILMPVIHNNMTYCDAGIVRNFDMSLNREVNEVLGIKINTIIDKYTTTPKEHINDLITYIKRIFTIITMGDIDYIEQLHTKYNILSISLDLSFYDLDITNDIKKRLIIMGYKKTYEYIINDR